MAVEIPKAILGSDICCECEGNTISLYWVGDEEHAIGLDPDGLAAFFRFVKSVASADFYNLLVTGQSLPPDYR